MDPNAALERLRRLAISIVGAYERREHQLSESQLADIAAEGLDMAQLFQGLDEWISRKRGFLPRDWDHYSPNM